MGSFDVELYEALVSVGIAPDRARAVVDGFERVVDARYAVHAQILATKRDLSEIEMRSMQRFAAIDGHLVKVDARFERIESRLDTIDLRFRQFEERFDARLDTRVADTKADLVRWMLTALTAQTAVLLAALKLI